MEITILNRSSRRTTLANTIEKAVRLLCEKFAGKYGLSSQTAVNIVLCDNSFIRELNSRYRNIDKATDVLSFPMREGADAQLTPFELGDIVISMEQARRQAVEEKWGLRQEMLLLVVHGFLHLLGYDDETYKEAQAMRALERASLDDILSEIAGQEREKGGVEA